jgi:hypothetical protein
MLPEGCGRKTIIMAAQFGYDRLGFEGNLVNVDKLGTIHCPVGQ